MADDGTIKDENALKIPPEVAERFGELVELIKGSKSMDDSERQYWIDVLPIMSEDQIDNLKGILDNEKKQLEEAKASYSKDMNTAVKKTGAAFDEQAYLEKKRAREEAEKKQQAEEKIEEEEVLKELAAV